MRIDLQVVIADKVGDSFEKLQVCIRAFIRDGVEIKLSSAFCKIANFGEVAS